MEILKQYLIPIFRVKKEYLAIIFSLLLFIFYPLLSRQIDHTAAPIDPGALSAIIMATFALLLFKAITWWLIKSIWPELANYADYHFAYNFRSLSPCYKVIIFLSFYLFLLFSFVLTLAALL